VGRGTRSVPFCPSIILKCGIHENETKNGVQEELDRVVSSAGWAFFRGNLSSRPWFVPLMTSYTERTPNEPTDIACRV